MILHLQHMCFCHRTGLLLGSALAYTKEWILLREACSLVMQGTCYCFRGVISDETLLISLPPPRPACKAQKNHRQLGKGCSIAHSIQRQEDLSSLPVLTLGFQPRSPCFSAVKFARRDNTFKNLIALLLW